MCVCVTEEGRGRYGRPMGTLRGSYGRRRERQRRQGVTEQAGAVGDLLELHGNPVGGQREGSGGQVIRIRGGVQGAGNGGKVLRNKCFLHP